MVEVAYGALADNTQRDGRALQLDLDGFHGTRRGDFRVIYSIDATGHRVVIRTISHRADAPHGGAPSPSRRGLSRVSAVSPGCRRS